jgi:hypothetical protein
MRSSTSSRAPPPLVTWVLSVKMNTPRVAHSEWQSSIHSFRTVDWSQLALVAVLAIAAATRSDLRLAGLCQDLASRCHGLIVHDFTVSATSALCAEVALAAIQL